MPMIPPFSVSYSMLTGTIRRESVTALLALMDVEALKQAGATAIDIRDSRGQVVSVAELKMLTGR